MELLTYILICIVLCLLAAWGMNLRRWRCRKSLRLAFQLLFKKNSQTKIIICISPSVCYVYNIFKAFTHSSEMAFSNLIMCILICSSISTYAFVYNATISKVLWIMNDNIFDLFCPSQIRFQLHHFMVLLSFLLEKNNALLFYILCVTQLLSFHSLELISS